MTKGEGTRDGRRREGGPSASERASERARVVGFWFCPPDPIFYRRRGKPQSAVVTAEKRLMD